MNNSNMYASFAEELEQLRARGQFRQLGRIERRDGVHADFNDARFLNLSSNDYLGIGGNQRLLEEFLRQNAPEHLLDRFGMSSSSSRLLTGNHRAYDLLEQALINMYHSEAACVFNSGYHANIGLLSALADRRDVIFSDKLNHASIVDGMKLSGARFFRYRHCDYAHLEELLAQHRHEYRRAIIVTESVFSMDGDLADVRRLAELKQAHDALLIVDEAHAVGVFGQTGCGVCEEVGVMPEIDLIMGGLGKACASLGGFAITNRLLKDYLVNTMRPLIFTTALPPIVLNWSRFALQKIAEMQAQRTHLRALSERFRQALRACGLRTDGASQIIPILIGDNQKTVNLSEQLRQRGWLIFAIRPPTVPPNTARLRLSLTAEMTWEQLAPLPGHVAEILHEMGNSAASA